MAAGHNCESGDILTVEKGNGDNAREVEFPEDVAVGDFMIVRGVGAYCSSMSLKNYNSYPESAEVLYSSDKDEFKVIRKI